MKFGEVDENLQPLIRVCTILLEASSRTAVIIFELLYDIPMHTIGEVRRSGREPSTPLIRFVLFFELQSVKFGEVDENASLCVSVVVVISCWFSTSSSKNEDDVISMMPILTVVSLCR